MYSPESTSCYIVLSASFEGTGLVLFMPPPPARVNSTSSGGSGLFGLPVRQDHREVINAGLGMCL